MLRLLGVDDEADEVRYLSNPWTLYDVLQAGGSIEVDVPLEGRGRCIYSMPASGYSNSSHVSAGPLDRATDEELSEVMSDGRTVKETLSGEAPSSALFARISAMDNEMKNLLERVLTDKAAARLKAQALTWPEKISVIERLRDARAEALQTMRVVGRRSAASPESMPKPIDDHAPPSGEH